MALVAAAVVACAVTSASRIQAVTTGTRMEYSVVSDAGATILHGDDVCVTSGGNTLCKSLGTLTPAGAPKHWTGSDAMGSFTAVTYTWLPVNVSTTTFSYDDGSAVMYRQEFLAELRGTSVGDPEAVSTAFPSFSLEPLPDAWEGYLQYGGQMVGSVYNIGSFKNASFSASLAGGTDYSAPACFWSKEKNASIVISAASEFMTSSQYVTADNKSLQYGVLGTVEVIPKGYQIDTIIVSHHASIRGNMMRWGGKLLARSGKSRSASELDFTVSYLQYSTDNGGYYHYNTEPGKSYQQTILDVKASTVALNLPVKQWLMDSWWYFQGADGGTKNWTAMPSVFPDGIQAVTEQTSWPIVAQNRFWSSTTDYAKQNGGGYNFIVEPGANGGKGAAIPQDQGFWDDLMASSKLWGLATYEQDWLNDEFNWLNCTKTSPVVASTWLRQMGDAARKHDLHIQYCMSLPRHIMASVEIPAVTQARASGDYNPGNDQWSPLGITSMFAHAVGIVPSKDSFWTTDAFTRPGAYRNSSEPYNRLQSAVATLSAGPVAFSDKVGMTDASLVMKSCAATGLLLKPDRPAMVLDHVLLNAVVHDSFFYNGEQWSTHSDLSGYRWSYVLLAATEEATVITPEELFSEEPWKRPAKMVKWEANSTGVLSSFTEDAHIDAGALGKWNFNFWTVAPVFDNGFALLGEFNKWVSASTKRFSDLTILELGFSVAVTGLPGEVVHLSYLHPSSPSFEPTTYSLTIPPSSTCIAKIPEESCDPR